MSIVTIANYFQFLCMCLSLIYSIRIIANNRVVSYMKYFYGYTVVAFGLGVYFIITSTRGEVNDTSKMINKISFVYHYSFLTFFIYGVLHSTFRRRLLLVMYIIGLIIVVSIVVNTLFNGQSFWIHTITNYILALFTLIYFYDLFEGAPKKSLSKEPSFWVISGLLVCLTLTIPVNAAKSFMDSKELTFYIDSYLTLMGAIAYGGMHLFFVKACLSAINMDTYTASNTTK